MNNLSCTEQWARYRKLRWQAFFAWLGGSYLGRFPSDLGTLTAHFGFPLSRTAFTVTFILCAITALSLLIYTWTRCINWKCPRCGDLFFGMGPKIFGMAGHNPFPGVAVTASCLYGSARDLVQHLQ